MHPILFRIPLPKMPLKLWWALAAIAAIAGVYALLGLRKRDRGAAATSIVVAAAAAGLGWYLREVKYEGANLPIYSYGVMLGLSLVVGWYLTLTLAEKDGLPKETMANCYVITALSAIAGSRLLYVATNPGDFNTLTDVFALRKGGLVAYGGFLGGYVASWLYLRANRIRLMPWADVAVPSLASGLMITRIGCYLYGCDFGRELKGTGGTFLAKLGSFPHWASGTLDKGDGSEAFIRHMKLYEGTETAAQIQKAGMSLPVHPTQLYESLVGLALLVLLLWQRKSQRFRGQIFFAFAFAYGYLRFLLELLRDDEQRGSFGPAIAEHWFVTLCLLAMGVAFAYGPALGLKNPTARLVARVAAFVPPVVAFLALKPVSFGKQVVVQLSTSQWIGFLSACLVSYFYAQFWNEARRAPALAMGLESLGDITPPKADEDTRKKKADDEDGEEADDAPKSVAKKKVKKAKPAAEAEASAEPEKAKVDGDAASDDAEPA